MDELFNNLYSKKVIDHVRHPRNMGFIKNPDGVAMVGNPVCGDIMKFYIKVEKKKGIPFLKDVKVEKILWAFDYDKKKPVFYTTGNKLFAVFCGSAIRSSAYIGKKCAELLLGSQ